MEAPSRIPGPGCGQRCGTVQICTRLARAISPPLPSVSCRSVWLWIARKPQNSEQCFFCTILVHNGSGGRKGGWRIICREDALFSCPWNPWWKPLSLLPNSPLEYPWSWLDFRKGGPGTHCDQADMAWTTAPWCHFMVRSTQMLVCRSCTAGSSWKLPGRSWRISGLCPAGTGWATGYQSLDSRSFLFFRGDGAFRDMPMNHFQPRWSYSI